MSPTILYVAPILAAYGGSIGTYAYRENHNRPVTTISSHRLPRMLKPAVWFIRLIGRNSECYSSAPSTKIFPVAGPELAL